MVWQAIGAGISALASAYGAREQNKADDARLQRQMSFQERMSSTAVRRAVKDYRAAGINPLMVTKFGGASSPPGASSPS